jgi:hypothetical protein
LQHLIKKEKFNDWRNKNIILQMFWD